MQWVRFFDRWPPKEGPNEYVCALAGESPIVYHVFIDSQNLTCNAEFYWLEGLSVPFVLETERPSLRIPRCIPPVPPKPAMQAGEERH